QIYCMGRCRYTATAVEDILNGQRSTTAMGIEICVSKNLGRCTQESTEKVGHFILLTSFS
ncbi:MAG: hypothetical protein IKU85_04260, partial [Bacteroidaceae bacterium]|nr:hypothetical protein [Bacteroidaceae bacterium]